MKHIGTTFRNGFIFYWYSNHPYFYCTIIKEDDPDENLLGSIKGTGVSYRVHLMTPDGCYETLPGIANSRDNAEIMFIENFK